MVRCPVRSSPPFLAFQMRWLSAIRRRASTAVRRSSHGHSRRGSGVAIIQVLGVEREDTESLTRRRDIKVGSSIARLGSRSGTRNGHRGSSCIVVARLAARGELEANLTIVRQASGIGRRGGPRLRRIGAAIITTRVAPRTRAMLTMIAARMSQSGAKNGPMRRRLGAASMPSELARQRRQQPPRLQPPRLRIIHALFGGQRTSRSGRGRSAIGAASTRRRRARLRHQPGQHHRRACAPRGPSRRTTARSSPRVCLWLHGGTSPLSLLRAGLRTRRIGVAATKNAGVEMILPRLPSWMGRQRTMIATRTSGAGW
mmetsp:Transcript_7875/g.21533  ORF Transcript_7875/g.21533 Transcript_7875/m.21533 type:complete len:314 (-) Transcript_7875:218-1159(-)